MIWGNAAAYHINKLQSKQKRAVRIIVKAHYLTHTQHLFQTLKILKVTQIITKSILLFTFKYKYHLLPSNCTNLIENDIRKLNLIQKENEKCMPSSKQHNLRFINEFKIPHYRTSLRAKSMKIIGPKTWYKYNNKITITNNLRHFQRDLQNVLN